MFGEFWGGKSLSHAFATMRNHIVLACSLLRIAAGPPPTPKQELPGSTSGSLGYLKV